MKKNDMTGKQLFERMNELLSGIDDCDIALQELRDMNRRSGVAHKVLQEKRNELKTWLERIEDTRYTEALPEPFNLND